VKYVNNKEDPLIQTVRMHQHNINSAMLQTARHFKTDLHKGTRQIQDSKEDNREMVREEGAWTIPT
jgi:hypothetical protein